MYRSLAALLVVLAPAESAATGVELLCSRLDAAEADELAARARLALGAQGATRPSSVVVGCDATTSVVLWDGPPLERIPIDERAGIVEGALEAIERRAREPVRTIDSGRPAPLPPPTPRPRVAPRLEARAEDEAGGAGLRFTLEPLPTIGPVMGSQLDIGVSLGGDFALLLTEGLRYGLGHFSAQEINVQAGVGWGAPFAPRRFFGVAATAGAEWLFIGTSAPTKDGALARATPIFLLGPRVAVRTSAIALWLGADAIYRSSSIDVDAPAIDFSAFGGVVSLGGVLLVRSGTLGL